MSELLRVKLLQNVFKVVAARQAVCFVSVYRCNVHSPMFARCFLPASIVLCIAIMFCYFFLSGFDFTLGDSF